MKSKLDLNLLKILVLLNNHKQLKPVAKALGKTESAISKHLSKLREQLDDALFVRGPTGYEPTEFTAKMLPSLSVGLDTINTALTYEQFDPDEYSFDIVIAMPSLALYWIGSDLLTDLMQTFPKAKVELLIWDDHTVSHIQEGRVDVGLHYFNPELPQNIHQQMLGHAKPAIVIPQSIVDRNIDRLLQLPFVIHVTKGSIYRGAPAELLLKAKGIHIQQRARVDNVNCVLNTIDLLGNCATLLPSVGNHRYDGFSMIEFPDELELGELPDLVAVYRLANQSSPLQEIITNRIKKYLFHNAP